MTKKIIIDTDPGQDDAIAILLALASPDEIELLGITTVAGNVPLSLTTRNACKICELAKRPDVKIFMGADKPLKGKGVTAEHVHGKTGLDGPVLLEPTMLIQSQNALDFILSELEKHPAKSISLCCLGPLTNIANLIKKFPHTVNSLAEIVLMGGGFFEGGNITPTAEFNFYADPEAADIVLKSGIPLTIMPLDVTHKVLTLQKRIDAIREIESPVALAVAEMLEFAERFDKEKYGSDGGPLHDPTVIAYLIDPTLFYGKMCNVEVEIDSHLTRGMSVVDWWAVTDRPKNALFINSVDSDGFFTLLTERLELLR